MDHNSEIAALQFGHGLLRDQTCSLARLRNRSNACVHTQQDAARCSDSGTLGEAVWFRYVRSPQD